MSGDYGVQAQVPADFDAPDKIVYGLTARQLAILAATAAVLWLAYQALTPLVPAAVIGFAALPIGGVAAAVAVGRRDGISLDRWLTAAFTAARAPRRLAAGPAVPAPVWAPTPRTAGGRARRRRPAQTPAVAPLRLPATAISDSGVVDLDGGGLAAITAVSTVNLDLRSPGEQHALVDGFGRWLQGLAAPVQIVVSTRPVDMYAYADTIDARLDELPHPALADAAADYAAFLRWLETDRDPLVRHVSIAHRVGVLTEASVARRHAEQTARALTGLGAATRVLDGDQVTDALRSACHPWQPATAGRAIPDDIITADRHGDLR